METLIVRTYVGLPRAGKSDDAKAWVAVDNEHRCRVGRDDIRRMLSGEHLRTKAQERLTSDVRNAIVRAVVRAGSSVVIDESTMRLSQVEHLRMIAASLDDLVQRGPVPRRVRFEVVSLLDVPLTTCLQRDAASDWPIGSKRMTAVWANGLRNMIANWDSLIVRTLSGQGMNNVDVIASIATAIEHPTSSDATTTLIRDLALVATKAKIAEYAPPSS